MKINIKELPSVIKSVRLNEVSDNQLDVEQNDYWTRETEKEYNIVTSRLDNISAKGKGYFIYVWYDISGFDYWVNNMREENYAQISVTFDKTQINKRQVAAFERKLNKVIDKVLNTICY